MSWITDEMRSKSAPQPLFIAVEVQDIKKPSVESRKYAVAMVRYLACRCSGAVSGEVRTV